MPKRAISTLQFSIEAAEEKGASKTTFGFNDKRNYRYIFSKIEFFLNF